MSTQTYDAPAASPSPFDLARQAICPNCRREDRSAIWGEPLRCDECHERDTVDPVHFHAIYAHPRFRSQRTLTFTSLEGAKAFFERHVRVGTYRADFISQCQCSVFTDLDDAMLTTIRQHDRDAVIA